MRRHILISGLVQGVGFRYATVRQARRLGLRGWVRNTPDGRVEVLAEGSPEGLARLTEWCHRGPPAARVERVEWRDVAEAEPLETFSIRW